LLVLQLRDEPFAAGLLTEKTRRCVRVILAAELLLLLLEGEASAMAAY